MVFTPTPTQARADAHPDRAEALRLFEHHDLVPVYRTLMADLETPVSVYWKLAQSGHQSFLLESVEGGEQISRYSLLGVNPRASITFQKGRVIRTAGGRTTARILEDGEDTLSVLKQELEPYSFAPVSGLPRFIGGAVGYLGYDVIREIERLPMTASDDLDIPEALFMLADTLVIFDHARHELVILSNAYNEGELGDPDVAYDDALVRVNQIVDVLRGPLPPLPETPEAAEDPLESNFTQAQYEENVLKAKEYIAAGDAFQIVLSQRLTCHTSASAFAIYRALRMLNPSPYMFFFDFGDGFHMIGASPEMMVRLEDGEASVHPIAGTRPRGKTDEEDRQLETELMADPKERAEHVMLVDLGRNDLGRVCDYGTVKVPRQMFVERYSHVMHLVSHVKGRIRQGLDAFDLLRATFPAGTLTGAPKIRAMQIIEELEGTRRGPYGGAVGYIGYDGTMDTCITIRTLIQRGNVVSVQAGAGIVADSNPTREYEESLNKARALTSAVRRAEQGFV